jgi:uncharacterized protein with HEPN domain
MSQRDDAVPIRHMLEHAKEALSLVSGRSREELHSHRMLPWREAIATRHRITHGYDVVDYDILWERSRTTFRRWSPRWRGFSPTSAS